MGNLLSTGMERSMPKGCVINMVKQDTTVKYGGYRKVWIPVDFGPGPSTRDITVLMDVNKEVDDVHIGPTDDDNNFLYEPGTPQCDAVNSVAVVNHVLTMYRRALRRAGHKQKLDKWNWGKDPLIVAPVAGEGGNAFYYRPKKMLVFLYFRSKNDPETWIYTNRTFDITCHEIGHAVLDMILAEGYDSEEPQAEALHEAFGDITAVFAVLAQLDSVHAVLVACKGDLHSDNFLSHIGEEMGLELLGMNGIRDAEKNFAIDEVTNQGHDLSQVFSSALYDALVEIYERNIDMSRQDPAWTLYETAQHMCQVVIVAFANTTIKDFHFMGVANKIFLAEPDAVNRAILQRHFDNRKIFDPNAKPKPKPPTPESSPQPGAAAAMGQCGNTNKIAMETLKRMVETGSNS